MAKRLTVSLKRNEALRATTVGVGKTKLVYILVADKRIRYADGKSRIAYIGTTSKGMSRIAYSVAKRADKILGIHGVRSFSARIVTCKPRKSVKTWHKLEQAFLLSFREKYGDVPYCNTQGKKMKGGRVQLVHQAGENGSYSSVGLGGGADRAFRSASFLNKTVAVC